MVQEEITLEALEAQPKDTYLLVYRPDLRFREYEVYRSHYCGLCHALQQRCNAISRLTLSYEFTFLSLLLDALYEPETDTHKQRCFCGIGKKATVYHSAVLDYVVDMHLFFAYLHCKDDWNDEHSISIHLAKTPFLLHVLKVVTI